MHVHTSRRVTHPSHILVITCLLVLLVSLLSALPALASATQWTWMSGLNGIDQPGNYGTMGTPDPGNVPGARFDSISWFDGSGDLWLFGGEGWGSSAIAAGYLNDLWRYDIVDDQWTWMSGDDETGQWGDYDAPDAVPGARRGSISWIDASGDLWLFGGYGYDSADALGYLNDLWRYDATSGEWTWMGGSEFTDQHGTYGALGVPHADNVPGARDYSISWIDGSGDLWLFGGRGYGSAIAGYGYLNDLWRYDISDDLWTWLGGGSDVKNQPGTYGDLGVAHADNIPGSRYQSISWVDGAGDLWLLGGYGFDSVPLLGYLNDLWRYDTTSGQWTWMSGSDDISQKGVYGSQGTPAPGNTPGARARPVAWTDGSGDLWLFGGFGYDYAPSFGLLNDLWQYGPASGQWTWVGGSNIINQQGTYGVLRTAAPGNIPGARWSGISWTDASGDFWCFGGQGRAVSSTTGYLNDLWRYEPDYSPNVVDLASLTASSAPGGIRVAWETGSELNNLGFNLYRAQSASGPATLVNGHLIPAKRAGSVAGASYSYLDRDVIPGRTYWYWLVDVDRFGGSARHGPVSALAPVDAPPESVSIVPDLGVSRPWQWVEFSCTYGDPDGWQDIRWAELLINDRLSGAGGVWVRYYPGTGRAILRIPEKGRWQRLRADPPTRMNPNAIVQLGEVVAEGETLQVTWRVKFKASMLGDSNTYLRVMDLAGERTRFVDLGDWTVAR